MHTKDEYLNDVMPYRMKSIDALRIASVLVMKSDTSRKMEMFFDGKLIFRGLSTAWTNPVIEAGIIHCRACLEFLGLQADPKSTSKLRVRGNKRTDDYGVEDWGLEKITIAEALAPYGGPASEAENSLAHVIHAANKGVAHTTKSLVVDANGLRLLEIAARGVPTLLINHLYVPLEIPIPTYKHVESPP